MKKPIFLIILLIIAAFCIWEVLIEARQDPIKVQEVVKDFGNRLKNISLLASQDTMAQSLRENYQGLVAPQLLSVWLKNPMEAPGRLVSSPWPDHIEIISSAPISANSYQITGKVIEMTSGDAIAGSFAAKRPVTIVVQKINNHWLISQCDLGDYETVIPQNLTTDNATELVFDYPASLAARFIYPQSWPPTLALSNQPFSCIETPAGSSLPERITERVINAKVYCVKATSEGAAGSVYTTYVYSGFIDNQTINLTFTLRYPQCNNYIDPEKTLCSEERASFDLDSVIAAILTSVRKP
jgi:hypothetical protein